LLGLTTNPSGSWLSAQFAAFGIPSTTHHFFGGFFLHTRIESYPVQTRYSLYTFAVRNHLCARSVLMGCVYGMLQMACLFYAYLGNAACSFFVWDWPSGLMLTHIPFASFHTQFVRRAVPFSSRYFPDMSRISCIYVCHRCTHFELQYLQCCLATLATSDLHLIEPTFSSYPQVCNQHSTSKQLQKHFHSLQLNTILYVTLCLEIDKVGV
jgi:hypothetical protein